MKITAGSCCDRAILVPRQPTAKSYKYRELYSGYRNATVTTMDQQTITLKCFRCGKPGRVLEMVMDASGKGMVCRPCAGLKPDGRPTSAAREMFTKPKSPNASRGKFACMNCKFRFSSSKPLDQVSCPYCGSRRINTPEQASADALLREAGGREYDF